MARVLIVEDEALVAWNLDCLLHELDHEVVGTAASLREALVLAANAPPDIALVDMNLANGATGLQVAQTLVDCYDTIVIAMVANPETIGTRTRHFRRTVVKPFSDRTVIFVLDWATEQLKRRSGTSVSRKMTESPLPTG